MKLRLLLILALFSTTPAFASSTFLVDFEKTWDNGNGGVDNYYNGGAAADGSTGGPNEGVSFTGVSGLSNDPSFTFYANAPTPEGVAYAFDSNAAYINIAGGAINALSFFYSSPETVLGAVKAYSGLNGSGTLLGTFDLVANDAGNAATESGFYATWTAATFGFSGTALSFDLSATANIVEFDNISGTSAVPVPAAFWLIGSGLAMIGGVNRRRGKVAA